jgi:hypothetical protein
MPNQWTSNHDPDRVDVWVRELLSNGEVESKVVKTLAQIDGITDANLRSSRQRVGVVVRRTTERSSRTMWSLPAEVDETAPAIDTSDDGRVTNTSTDGDTSTVEPFLPPRARVDESYDLINSRGRSLPICPACQYPTLWVRRSDGRPGHPPGVCFDD